MNDLVDVVISDDRRNILYRKSFQPLKKIYDNLRTINILVHIPKHFQKLNPRFGIL